MVISAKAQSGQTAKDQVDSLLLDIKGAAAFLGLTPWQLRGLIVAGQLDVIRIGRKFYLRRATLIRWAERSESRVKA